MASAQAMEMVEFESDKPAGSSSRKKPGVAGRLVSLDALRGFDMLWIIGIDGIIDGLRLLLKPSLFATDKPLGIIANQLQHKDWRGIAFEDLIFPLFLFIVGVSIVFSLSKAISAGGKPRAILRIVTRAALLYLFGLMVYGGFDQPILAFAGQTREPVAHHAIRWMGVLQRIAICYAATAILFCLLRPRFLIVTAVVLLAGYWLLVAYVPVPGQGKPSFEEGKNLTNYLDQQYLGGYKWDGDHDPEGYLSTLPAIGTCLLGVFAGLILRGTRLGQYAKVAILILGGAALVGAGFAWGFLPSPIQFPVIKKIWTSSYVLIAGGYSAALLGLFYLIIDVWELRGWAAPFVWIGGNAILLYMAAELGAVAKVAHLLVGGKNYETPFIGKATLLVSSLVSLGLLIGLAGYLYRRRIFIRV